MGGGHPGVVHAEDGELNRADAPAFLSQRVLGVRALFEQVPREKESSEKPMMATPTEMPTIYRIVEDLPLIRIPAMPM